MITANPMTARDSTGICSSLQRKLAELALSLALLFALAAPCAAQVQPKVRNLTEQEIVDMIVGNAIYCSSGHPTQVAIDKVKAAFKDGKNFQMISIEDLPPDWLALTTFGIGGGGAWPEVTKRYEHLNLKWSVFAFAPEKVLSEYLGEKFQAMYSLEAGQFSNAVLTASRLGLPLIDGDPIGRCVPELPMFMFLHNGISLAPLAGETMFGDVFFFPKIRDVYRAEDVLRALAVGSGGGVYVASNPMTGAQIKEHLAPNFHSSHAGRVGRAAREAVAAKKDPVAAVVAAGNGYLLFTGKVTRSDTKGERGFGRTDAELAGTGKFAGSTYRIYNKNENMVAWRDGKLDAAAPDIIAALDPKTGWPMVGSKTVLGGFVVGEELSIVGLPAVPLPYRTPKAIELMGPRHFGFDVDYVPIEKLHGKATE